MSNNVAGRYMSAMNRLTKWRLVFTSWMWGTLASNDPTGAATRDLFEKALILRVEVTAMTALLIEKGICTSDEFMEKVIEECSELDKMLQGRFPGARATPIGMHFDTVKFAETARRLNFKP